MTFSGFVIRKSQYYDSVFLMGIGKRISEAPGVWQNAVLMGSDANKLLLRRRPELVRHIDGSDDPSGQRPFP